MLNWTTDQLRKLRAYYASLLGQSQILSQGKKNAFVRDTTFAVIAEEISRIDKDFPGLLPSLRPDQLHYNQVHELYDLAGVQSYLATCLGRLKVELEEAQNTPVTERLEFSFY
jgi:hypothetical protein